MSLWTVGVGSFCRFCPYDDRDTRMKTILFCVWSTGLRVQSSHFFIRPWHRTMSGWIVLFLLMLHEATSRLHTREIVLQKATGYKTRIWSHFGQKKRRGATKTLNIIHFSHFSATKFLKKTHGRPFGSFRLCADHYGHRVRFVLCTHSILHIQVPLLQEEAPGGHPCPAPWSSFHNNNDNNNTPLPRLPSLPYHVCVSSVLPRRDIQVWLDALGSLPWPLRRYHIIFTSSDNRQWMVV